MSENLLQFNFHTTTVLLEKFFVKPFYIFYMLFDLTKYFFEWKILERLTKVRTKSNSGREVVLELFSCNNFTKQS